MAITRVWKLEQDGEVLELEMDPHGLWLRIPSAKVRLCPPSNAKLGELIRVLREVDNQFDDMPVSVDKPSEWTPPPAVLTLSEVMASQPPKEEDDVTPPKSKSPLANLRFVTERNRDLARDLSTKSVAAVEFNLPGAFPEAREEGHKNVVEALRETNGAISHVRSETRKRNLWAYLLTNDSPEAVAAFFGKPNATTVIGANASGQRLVGVWCGEGEPTLQPEFV